MIYLYTFKTFCPILISRADNVNMNYWQTALFHLFCHLQGTNAITTCLCFLHISELKTGFSSVHVPLCIAGKRHRIQSCEKPAARFNWRLTCLLTRVAGETVAKAVWAAAQPGSPHIQRHTCTCTHIPLLFATTYYDTVQDTLRKSQRRFGLTFETSNGLLSKSRAKKQTRIAALT